MAKASKMKTYNKLVRDKIPQIIEKSGKEVIFKTLAMSEYKKALNNKLIEEIKEYSKSKSIEELADIEEVILAILKVRKISKSEFDKIRLRKVRERGAFNKRIKLLKVKD